MTLHIDAGAEKVARLAGYARARRGIFSNADEDLHPERLPPPSAASLDELAMWTIMGGGIDRKNDSTAVWDNHWIHAAENGCAYDRYTEEDFRRWALAVNGNLLVQDASTIRPDLWTSWLRNYDLRDGHAHEAREDLRKLPGMGPGTASASIMYLYRLHGMALGEEFRCKADLHDVNFARITGMLSFDDATRHHQKVHEVVAEGFWRAARAAGIPQEEVKNAVWPFSKYVVAPVMRAGNSRQYRLASGVDKEYPGIVEDFQRWVASRKTGVYQKTVELDRNDFSTFLLDDIPPVRLPSTYRRRAEKLEERRSGRPVTYGERAFDRVIAQQGQHDLTYELL